MTISIVFLLVSLFLFCFAPEGYSLLFCWICALIYLLSSYICVRRDFQKRFYVSFSIIFYIFLFLSSFIVPLFLHSTYSFLDNYINKGTALVTFAACAYNWGWQGSNMRAPVFSDDSTFSFIPQMTKDLVNTSCIIVLVVYIFLLSAFMRTIANQTNDFDVVYFVLILNAILTSTLIINVVANKHKCYSFITFLKHNLFIIVSILVVLFSFLSFGDRTTPIYLAIIIIGTYELFVKRLKLPTVLIISIAALLIMFTVGQTRIASRDDWDESLIERTQTTLSNTSSIVDVFSDYFPASTSLYLCIDYVKTNDAFYYPGKILITLLSPIPFLPSLLSKELFRIPNGELASGYLTTAQFNRKVQAINGGLGTHCVGDIYLSWGLLGVLIAFFLLGRLIGTAQLHSRSSIYWAIVYISMLGNSVYIPRATLFDSYRLIVFQLFIVWVLRKLRY